MWDAGVTLGFITLFVLALAICGYIAERLERRRQERLDQRHDREHLAGIQECAICHRQRPSSKVVWDRRWFGWICADAIDCRKTRRVA